MSKRRDSVKRRCQRCFININMCFCESITNIQTKTHISIIFHVKEYFLTSNTGKIANLSLSNSSFEIRGVENTPLKEDYTRGGIYQPYYLYPSEDAQLLDSHFINKHDKPINLVVPDATWRQTKKFHKREPNLKGIPHVKLPFSQKSLYQLRKQKSEEGLCTIEAIAFSLGCLGDKTAQSHLINILEVMNKKVMETRTHHFNKE